LPNRGAANAQLLGEFSLRHEPVSGFELLSIDELSEALDHLLVNGAAVDGLESR
jgi:hypothetical protein